MLQSILIFNTYIVSDMNDMYFLDFRAQTHTRNWDWIDGIKYKPITDKNWERYRKAFPILRDNEFNQKFYVDIYNAEKFVEIIDFLDDEEKGARIDSAVLTSERYAQFLLMFG